MYPATNPQTQPTQAPTVESHHHNSQQSIGQPTFSYNYPSAIEYAQTYLHPGTYTPERSYIPTEAAFTNRTGRPYRQNIPDSAPNVPPIYGTHRLHNQSGFATQPTNPMTSAIDRPHPTARQHQPHPLNVPTPEFQPRGIPT